MTKENNTPRRTPRRLAAARGERILRLPSVMDKTGLSRSQVYRDLGHMRIKLSPNTVGWIETEIEKWVGERIAASRASAPVAE